MRNYIAWLRTAAILQFIAAAIHATSFFIQLSPANDTEKQLFSLMDTYKFDLGAGFHRTMGDLTLALSVSFCFMCILGGLLNWYLIRKKTGPEIMKGVIIINLVVFGIYFGIVTAFTFLLPIISIGLIIVFLILSLLTIRKDN